MRSDEMTGDGHSDWERDRDYDADAAWPRAQLESTLDLDRDHELAMAWSEPWYTEDGIPTSEPPCPPPASALGTAKDVLVWLAGEKAGLDPEEREIYGAALGALHMHIHRELIEPTDG